MCTYKGPFCFLIRDCKSLIFIIAHTYSVQSEIVGLASQLATQNYLGCYLKLNLRSKFHAEVATHYPHIKLRVLYTLNIILYYNRCLTATQSQLIVTQLIHDFSGNFHAQIATQLYKIISNTDFHSHKRTCIHTCIHTYIHTYIHT